MAHLPHFQKLAQELQENVDFFQKYTHIGDLQVMHYLPMPSTSSVMMIDWGNARSLSQAFPPLRKKGQYSIPLALVLEATTVPSKLVVINYWRNLTSIQQQQLKQRMRYYYLRPSLSKERICWDDEDDEKEKEKEGPSIAAASLATTTSKIIATFPQGLQDNNSNNNKKDIVTIAETPRFAKAVNDLSERVLFFREMAPLQEMQQLYYTTVPSNMDWNDISAIHKAFPPLVHNTTTTTTPPSQQPRRSPSLQFPLCLILETISEDEKLVVVNWWRYLETYTLQYTQVMQETLRTIYRAPTKSKDLMLFHHNNHHYSRAVVNDGNDNDNPDDDSSSNPPHDGQQFHNNMHLLQQQQQQQRRRRRRRRNLEPSWGFRCLETCQQLADKLKLSNCDMLQTANLDPSGATCKSDTCVYPALCNNSGYCCFHRISFAPLSGRERGRRGYLLIGAAYTKPNGRQCSCQDETCVGIGFSDAMIRFDVSRLSEELQSEVCDRLLLLPKSRKHACLAPWHFHPDHRVFLPDGSWKLVEHRRASVFQDPVSGKEWSGLPPPTYSPKQFLEEPVMVEYQARKKTSLLPPWVREYQRLEEGPLSIHEQQTNLLWERIRGLEEKLSTQALQFEASYFALEKDMAQLQGKYDEKKHLKRRTPRKRKTASSGHGASKKSNAANDHLNNHHHEEEVEVGPHEEEYHHAANAVAVHPVEGGGRVPGPTAVAHYNAPPVETYAPYYQERSRYGGGWPNGQAATRYL